MTEEEAIKEAKIRAKEKKREIHVYYSDYDDRYFFFYNLETDPIFKCDKHICTISKTGRKRKKKDNVND